MTARVLGLDLSITATGVALPNGGLDVILTREAGDRRLKEIACRIGGIIHQHHPTLAVIEDIPPIRAHSLAVIGMVQGVTRLILQRAAVPYALITPGTLKLYATGRGTATKPDMRMALYQRTGGIDVRDDNQVDAAWLRAAGLDHLGQPPLAMPKVNRAALAKVAWPTVAHPRGPWTEADFDRFAVKDLSEAEAEAFVAAVEGRDEEEETR